MNKIFLKECFLQKTNQYEALDVLSKDENALNLGSELFLCFDEKFDKDKKIVFAKKKNTEKVMTVVKIPIHSLHASLS